MLCSIYTIAMSRNEELPLFNRIAHVREEMGLSRKALADAVGVHYQTIGYLERGEYSPSLSLALRISSALGRPIEQLFSVEPFASDEERTHE